MDRTLLVLAVMSHLTLNTEAVGRIYQKLIEEMRNWEAKLDFQSSSGARAQPSLRRKRSLQALPLLLATRRFLYVTHGSERC
jgi:hypothetical protein